MAEQRQHYDADGNENNTEIATLVMHMILIVIVLTQAWKQEVAITTCQTTHVKQSISILHAIQNLTSKQVLITEFD